MAFVSLEDEIAAASQHLGFLLLAHAVGDTGRTHDQLMEQVDALPERERYVIRARFGIDGKLVKRLEDIGREYPNGPVTRERIRQVEQRAIGRLKKELQNA